MRFYLGTHNDSWLKRFAVPFCVSYRILRERKRLPEAQTGWLLDSGGFSELSLHGRWTYGAEEYAEGVERIIRGVGKVDAAAIQDWMCEPFIIEKTGGSVAEHQERTVQSYLDLTALAPSVPWMPVVQGWQRSDYRHHVSLYKRAGVDLAALPLVGVGSVCRRQAMGIAVTVLRDLASLGLSLHGFGFKITGLPKAIPYLASADSLAWSFTARRQPPLPGHSDRHKNCANCPDYAMAWRARLLRQNTTWQLPMLFAEEEVA